MGIKIHYPNPNAGGGAGSITTADNGLRINPAGNVKLGGSLIETTTVDLGNEFLHIVGTSTGRNFNANFTNDAAINQLLFLLGPTGIPEGAQFIMQSDNVADSSIIDIHVSKAAGLMGFRMDLNNPFISVFDSINNIGMSYQNDYSAIGLTDPRWIPDLAAVEGLSFYLTDGALSSDRTVDLDTHGLSILDNTNGSIIVGFFSDPTNPSIDLQVRAPTGNTQLNMQDASFISLVLQDIGGNDLTFIADPVNSWQFIDNINALGARYAADYTANQLADDRAITDVGGVREMIRSVDIDTNLTPGVTTTGAVHSVPVPGSGTSFAYLVTVNLAITGGTGTMQFMVSWLDANGVPGSFTSTPQGPAPGTAANNVISLIVQSGSTIDISSIAAGTITADFYSIVKLLASF